LRSLNEGEVDYVLIGAAAFPVHGYARATLDIDIFIRPERKNAERTLEALRTFGYDVTDLAVDDLLKKKILIRQYVVELDVHPFVAGAEFEGVSARSVEGRFGSVPVRYASLDDLIAMKEAAGRPKDIEDLKALRLLRERRARPRRP
jgi:predicted nucleotidyltransferase